MPRGFRASGIAAGLKRSGKPDLALLLAPSESICVGTFTKSLVRAACVDLCIDRLQRKLGKVRAVIINSGQANACTGELGLLNSLEITKAVATHLHLKEEEVLICSTGVIGSPIPIEKLLFSLDQLIEGLSENGGDAAAKAILTTDLVTKQIAFEGCFGDRNVRIGGMAKGSGMIHPNMATMLGYLSCDAAVPYEIWDGMVKRAVDCSFNSITVDGDTSTNDSFLAFSSGDPLAEEYFDDLEIGLNQTCQYLAKAIARDGEGANCLIEVHVEGAQNHSNARQIARTICSSSLVKTAIHGANPNWGRIIAAAGRSGITFSPNYLSLWIGPHQLMEKGEAINFDEKLVSTYIGKKLEENALIDDSVLIRLIVGDGPGSGVVWGCDLSDSYVRINADYTT